MACLIGTFWSVFGLDESYKDTAFKTLNEMVIKIWLKSMVGLATVNTGAVYKLDESSRQHIVNFLSMLEERVSDVDRDIDSIDSSPVAYRSRSSHF